MADADAPDDERAARSGVFVTTDRRPDGVAVVRLDRPKANALCLELLDQLEAVAKALAADPPGAVVVWGGERIFAAGADINELANTPPGTVADRFHAALGALAEVPRATIAAVNGFALGGGLELALACDFRVASSEARLGLPEVLLGIIPGGGGTQRLPRLIGPSRAKDLILSGRQVQADEALAMGLVNRVVPSAEVFDAALQWAAELARGAVVAQSLGKAAVDLGAETTLAEALHVERGRFVAAFRTEDAGRGIASFIEHGPGKASFVGR
ncbi:MAG TPA: enoyl-CoA hydratase/isomerase family protein [Acidimicrobiales bacterium]